MLSSISVCEMCINELEARNLRKAMFSDDWCSPVSRLPAKPITTISVPGSTSRHSPICPGSVTSTSFAASTYSLRFSRTRMEPRRQNNTSVNVSLKG